MKNKRKDHTNCTYHGCKFIEEIEPELRKKNGVCIQKRRRGRWLCECGRIFETRIDNITSGRTKSCGCKKMAAILKVITKHGCCRRSGKLRIYSCWTSMKARCLNKKHQKYKGWGGRGIKVYKPWISSFSLFHEWFKNEFHLEDIPKGFSIDRKDNNSGYFPNNLRLATDDMQANNKRNTIKFVVDNKEENINSLSKKFTINRRTLCGRIRRGWSIEEALNTPVKQQKSLAITTNPD